MSRTITGATIVAGVAGAPVRHSLSPLIHNAWLAAAGIDGAYVPFAPGEAGFEAFVRGLRGGVIRGLNITLPFKEAALAAADRASEAARLAGAANLLVFEADGRIVADNTDGAGLLAAFAAQAPGFDATAGPAVIVGAGGAARGAAAAFLAAGAPEVRILNRTVERARKIATALGEPMKAWSLERARYAFRDSAVVINATSANLAGQDALALPLEATPETAVIMDMVYKPLETPTLAHARRLGRRTVDGLEMLVRQAAPSFEAFFGRPPPPEVDVRGLCLAALAARP